MPEQEWRLDTREIAEAFNRSGLGSLRPVADAQARKLWAVAWPHIQAVIGEADEGDNPALRRALGIATLKALNRQLGD